MLGYATGLIHPVYGGWFLEKPMELAFPDGKWILVVRDSRFHLFLHGPPPEDVATLRNEIVSLVQGCLDGMAFHLAASLRVEVVSLVIDGTHLVHFTTQWPDLLEGPLRAQIPEGELQPFFQAALTEPLARAALADLRSAIEMPDDTSFLAYRALESVRQWFLAVGAEDEENARKQSWAKMRSELGVGEKECRRLASLAAVRRHGGVQPPTASERLEALRFARQVVAQFVAYLARRGS